MKRPFHTNLWLVLVCVAALSPYAALAQSGTTGALQNPLIVSSFCGLFQRILTIILAVGTPVAALFLVYAGFLFIIARGKPDKLKNAKANLGYVFIGIFIFLGAWLLGQVIANTIKALSPVNAASAGACS